MLDILIDRKLAKAEAKRYGLTVPEKDLQKALEDIRKKNGFADDAALSQALVKDGMTMEQLRHANYRADPTGSLDGLDD